MPDAPTVVPAADPQAPLGHLSRLGSALVVAHGIDEIATSLFADLTALPGVRRIGFALSEGGGRRLRFTASDRPPAEGAPAGSLDWCHIDAYDDVPLTLVARSGEPVLGAREELSDRFGDFVAGQPEEVKALAAVPLPGTGSPIGGLLVYLEEAWAFDERQRRLLEATARRTAEAVRRVRASSTHVGDDDDLVTADASTARIVLDDDTRAPGVARRFLREFLARSAVDEDVSATAELCLSELVTNAVVHAGSRSELRATLDDDRLTVAVSDRGGVPVDAADAAPDEDPDVLRVHGRGLQLVEALADRWGSERDAVGTTVWFALELHHDAGAVGLDATG